MRLERIFLASENCLIKRWGQVPSNCAQSNSNSICLMTTRLFHVVVLIKDPSLSLPSVEQAGERSLKMAITDEPRAYHHNPRRITHPEYLSPVDEQPTSSLPPYHHSLQK